MYYLLEFEAPIMMETKEEIAAELRKIADAIDHGTEAGFIPGELQFMEWFITKEGEDE